MRVRRTCPLLSAAALVSGALALVPITAGGQTAPCEEPYSPVAHAVVYPVEAEATFTG